MQLQNIDYKITFYSFWHVGGKDGANMKVDNAVLKDKNGLPYIGGKTIKGLIKDGAVFIKKCQPKLIKSEEFLETVFGSPDKEYSSIQNNIQLNKFSSVVVGQKLEKGLEGLLFHDKTAIEITDKKQAQNHSLRVMELVIPLELYGTIENFDSNRIEDLELCLKAVKKLGVKRTRSLGQCIIEIVKPLKDENNV